jgi:hypothetical protein
MDLRPARALSREHLAQARDQKFPAFFGNLDALGALVVFGLTEQDDGLAGQTVARHAADATMDR